MMIDGPDVPYKRFRQADSDLRWKLQNGPTHLERARITRTTMYPARPHLGHARDYGEPGLVQSSSRGQRHFTVQLTGENPHAHEQEIQERQKQAHRLPTESRWKPRLNETRP